MVDRAAKEAIGWRKVKEETEKSIDIDTSHTSPSPDRPFLRTAVKTSLAEDYTPNGKKESRGLTLYKIAPKPSRKVLHLQNKLPMWISSLIIQMRTGRIR